MQTVYLAFSQSAPLASRLTAIDQPFCILSLHARACNLLSEQGELMALVAPQHGNGPFHIVVPPLLLQQIQTDDLVRLVGATFYFPRFQLSLQAASVWDPHLPRPIAPISVNALRLLNALINQHIAFISLIAHPIPTSPAAKRAEQGIHCFLQGMATGVNAALATGVQQLAGLGPGLTPAGDDFLLGALAALQMALLEMQTAQHGALCQQISAWAVPQTTRLSAAWLRCAGLGDFGEPWHQLQAALRHEQPGDVQIAAQTILQQGATSGVVALLGFCLTQRCLQESDVGLLPLIAQIQLASALIGGQIKNG